METANTEQVDKLLFYLGQQFDLRFLKLLEKRTRSRTNVGGPINQGSMVSSVAAASCCGADSSDANEQGSPPREYSRQTIPGAPTAATDAFETSQPQRDFDGTAQDRSCCNLANPQSRTGILKYQPPVLSMRAFSDDTIGADLDYFLSDRGLRSILPQVIETSASVYFGLLRKAKLSGEPEPTAKELKFIRSKVILEALSREIVKRIRESNFLSNQVDSKEAGVLANPAKVPHFTTATDGTINLLTADTLLSLFRNNGFAVQDGFLGADMCKQVLRDVELLEFDGRLLEPLESQDPSLDATLQHRSCWIPIDVLTTDSQKGLQYLLERLALLPHELNRRATLSCKTITMCYVAFFPANGSSMPLKWHSGFSPERDNGRQISVTYFPNSTDWKEQTDGGAMKLYRAKRTSSRPTQEPSESPLGKGLCFGSTTTTSGEYSPDDYEIVYPKGDRLVISLSRCVPVEVMPTFRRRFSVTVWIPGPISIREPC